MGIEKMWIHRSARVPISAFPGAHDAAYRAASQMHVRGADLSSEDVLSRIAREMDGILIF